MVFLFSFFFLTRLSLPTTHNPAPAIYLCQLALMPARHQVPLLVSRRQPVCTKWCRCRVHLLSWFQSLQQTTGRQWSERLQPRGFPSKFYLFPSTTGCWLWFPREGISEKNPSTCDSDIDLPGYTVQDKSQSNLSCVYWNRCALCCSFMFHNGKVGKTVTSYKHKDIGTAYGWIREVFDTGWDSVTKIQIASDILDAQGYSTWPPAAAPDEHKSSVDLMLFLLVPCRCLK